MTLNIILVLLEGWGEKTDYNKMNLNEKYKNNFQAITGSKRKIAKPTPDPTV